MTESPWETNGSIVIKTPAGGFEPAEGASFAEAVKGAARFAGYKRFRVYVGGAEVTVEAAPATLSEAQGEVEIRPYDKAG